MDKTMETTLFVVARERHDLYASLVRTFETDEAVRVILDRRLGERRRRLEARAVDHRRGARRARPEVDTQLRSRGWALLSLPPSAPGSGVR